MLNKYLRQCMPIVLIWSLYIFIYMFRNVTLHPQNMNNYYVPIKKKMGLGGPLSDARGKKFKNTNEQKDLLKTAVYEQEQARNTVKQNTYDFESSI